MTDKPQKKEEMVNRGTPILESGKKNPQYGDERRSWSDRYLTDMEASSNQSRLEQVRGLYERFL